MTSGFGDSLLEYASKNLTILLNNVSLIIAASITGWLFWLWPFLNKGLSTTMEVYLPIITVLLTTLILSLLSIEIFKYYRNRKENSNLNKSFHIAEREGLFTIDDKNPDSIVTSFTFYFDAINSGKNNIFITVKVGLKYKILCPISITPDAIPSETKLGGIVNFSSQQLPKRLRKKEKIKIKLYFTDAQGYTQVVPVIFENFSIKYKKNNAKKMFPLEGLSCKAEPTQRIIIDVFRLELRLYEKHGRRSGGLGSIHFMKNNRVLPANTVNLSRSDSYENNSISANPSVCTVESNNLDSLITFYTKLTQQDKKERFVQCLIDRIGPEQGYLSISYFIVFVLFKLGYLCGGLNKVKFTLRQDEAEVYGFSNVLFLLRRLLYHHHPEFTEAALDHIEQFAYDLKEQSLDILEQISEIRVLRALAPASIRQACSLV